MRNFILLLLVGITFSSYGQVYNGIVQPTDYRLLLAFSNPLTKEPVSNLHSFVSYRKGFFDDKFKVIALADYNISKDKFTIGSWLNYNIGENLYVMTMFSYGISDRSFNITPTFTWRLPYNLHIGGSMFNALNSTNIQILGGVSKGMFIFNAGASYHEDGMGFVTNVRFQITGLNWLQLRYDTYGNTLGVVIIFNFNSVNK